MTGLIAGMCTVGTHTEPLTAADQGIPVRGPRFRPSSNIFQGEEMKIGVDLWEYRKKDIQGFVRIIGGRFPNVHKGPKPGGKFWALATCNDLPLFPQAGKIVFMTPEEFFDRHEEVYIANAEEEEQNWERIYDYPSQFEMKYGEDYDTGIYSYGVPYMPEIYAVRRRQKE
jgi:hypothetical protein